MRPDGRADDELRPVTFERDYTEMADGSCLVTFGRTKVLCTASVDDNVPRWIRGSGKGWVSAEYSMLPGASPERVDREAAKGKQSGRTVEIQRLIGRSLRAACDLTVLGERQVTVDCDVLQADGGTRTASICGGFLALHDALSRLMSAKRADRPADALVLRRGERRHRRRRADARPRLRRGQRGRRRHERRHRPPARRRRAPLRRGPGHRRGRAVQQLRAVHVVAARRGAGSPRSSSCRRR